MLRAVVAVSVLLCGWPVDIGGIRHSWGVSGAGVSIRSRSDSTQPSPLVAASESRVAAAATYTAATPTPPRATPAMAWNAWNTFSVNGKPIRGGRVEYESMAAAMIDSGMVAAGYTLLSTVCTDWVGRDPITHQLQENTTLWPGGMKSFAAFLHGKGMQLSVYTDAGTHNCCGEPGSLGYEALDMATFASWDVDAVGVDYCGGPSDIEIEYQKFADGIVKSNRGMQLEVWNLGRGQAYAWAPSLSVNMTIASPSHAAFVPHMRLTTDIGNVWDGKVGPTMSVLATVDEIEAITDMWAYGMGNHSGTFPNYGRYSPPLPHTRARARTQWMVPSCAAPRSHSSDSGLTIRPGPPLP
jgi:hypothetical protein